MHKNAVGLFLGGMILFLSGPSASADIHKDLLVYFSCDKKIKDGFINNDAPGPGKGQVFGAVTLVPGRVGQGACRFEGSGPTVESPLGEEAHIRVQNNLNDPKRSLNVGFGNEAEFTLATWYR